LLIEEQRTNIAPNPIIGGAWTPGGCTVTAAAGIAPDGTNTMVRMAETAVNELHLQSYGQGFAGGGQWTGSVFAKAAGVRYLQFCLDDGGANGVWATFDLASGIVSGPISFSGTWATVGAVIQSAGNGIWRCSVSFTPAGTTLRPLLITSNVANPGRFPSYSGNTANAVLVWGAQIEQGAFATSYIPGSGPVTRAADITTMPTNVSWFSGTTGTIMSEAMCFGSSVGGAFNTTTSLNDGSASNRIEAIRNDLTNLFSEYMMIGGSFVSSAGVGNAVANVPFKAAMNYTSGSQKGTLNGAAVTSLGTSAALTPVTQMHIGHVTGAQILNGYIRRVQYWNRVLSDIEMQQVTL
jgi:hypothetical protein